MTEPQRRYHHGELPEALVEASLRLARTGGAAAVTLRAVTREAGVSATAAYRHFSDHGELIRVTARRARAALADSMLAAIHEPGTVPEGAQQAVQRLRGVGLGYIRFALDEPGWFDLAFSMPDDGDAPDTLEPGPFELLVDALDTLVDAGVLAPGLRAGAEWTCWGSVHGFADLAARGPLREQPRAVIDQLGRRVVDAVIAGVVAGSIEALSPADSC